MLVVNFFDIKLKLKQHIIVISLVKSIELNFLEYVTQTVSPKCLRIQSNLRNMTSINDIDS